MTVSHQVYYLLDSCQPFFEHESPFNKMALTVTILGEKMSVFLPSESGGKVIPYDPFAGENDKNLIYPPLPPAGEGRGEAEGGPLASEYIISESPPHLFPLPQGRGKKNLFSRRGNNPADVRLKGKLGTLFTMLTNSSWF